MPLHQFHSREKKDHVVPRGFTMIFAACNKKNVAEPLQ